MYMYIYTYIYTYIHTYIHTYVGGFRLFGKRARLSFLFISSFSFFLLCLFLLLLYFFLCFGAHTRRRQTQPSIYMYSIY